MKTGCAALQARVGLPMDRFQAGADVEHLNDNNPAGHQTTQAFADDQQEDVSLMATPSLVCMLFAYQEVCLLPFSHVDSRLPSGISEPGLCPPYPTTRRR